MKKKDIWKRFHEAGFGDIWYPSCHPIAEFRDKRAGPRFYAGMWTGPEYDLIAVKWCETNREANLWLSPAGWTPEEAVELALELLEVGPEEFDRRHPGNRAVGNPCREDSRFTDAEPFIRSVAAFVHPYLRSDLHGKISWRELERSFLGHLRKVKREAVKRSINFICKFCRDSIPIRPKEGVVGHVWEHDLGDEGVHDCKASNLHQWLKEGGL